jgi:aryl-alcohol dehydrogenase-like predicted oxidoreductase
VEYRVLGKTGLRVSKLGLGGSSLGGVFRKIDEPEAIRAVHVAIDLGINFIDVAPYYGLTKAEALLGKALRGIPRDRYYLATKVGRYGDTEFDFSAQRIRTSVEESLGRLALDYVDVVQCHDIEYGSLDQIVEETLPTLRKIQKEGKARFIGITGFPLKIFRRVLNRAEVDTVLSYCHYTLANTSFESLLSFLQKQNVGIINAAALGMGLFTKQGTPVWHPAPKEVKAACARASAYCRSRGVDIEQLALRFALANPNIHITLVGTADPEETKANVRAAESPIDVTLLNQVQAVLQPIRNKSWLVGRPENN